MQCAAPTELTIDYEALPYLSTSVKEPENCYNKVDLAEIRESYDGGQLGTVHWDHGTKLLADAALANDNKHTAGKHTDDILLDAISKGQHDRPKEMKTNLGLPPSWSSRDDRAVRDNRDNNKGTGGEK